MVDVTKFREVHHSLIFNEEKYSFYNTIKKLCANFEAQAILENYDLSEPIPPHEREGHHPKPPLHHHK